MSQITINRKEVYWILSAFKTLDKISTTLNGDPMKLKPEVVLMLKRLRTAVRDQENNPDGRS